MPILNIHPIFVHFPIALLTVYALFEVCRLPVLTRQQWWFPVKGILLIIGVCGGAAALLTGKAAEGAYFGTSTMNLVRLHSAFAQASVWVYGLLTALYIIEWLRREKLLMFLPNGLQQLWNALCTIELTFFLAPILILGAIAGLSLITITGALGGAIVYGPDIDPIVSVIYHLFFAK